MFKDKCWGKLEWNHMVLQKKIISVRRVIEENHCKQLEDNSGITFFYYYKEKLFHDIGIQY